MVDRFRSNSHDTDGSGSSRQTTRLFPDERHWSTFILLQNFRHGTSETRPSDHLLREAANVRQVKLGIASSTFQLTAKKCQKLYCSNKTA